MARRTAEQKLAHHMKKMADMGVTISVTPAPGSSSVSPIIQTLADAAKNAGILEESGSDPAPDLTPAERAEVDRFGIHDEDKPAKPSGFTVSLGKGQLTLAVLGLCLIGTGGLISLIGVVLRMLNL